MAGYSGKPLAEKLGITSGMHVIIVNEPEHFRNILGSVVKEIHVAQSISGEAMYIHLFTKSRHELESYVPKILKHLALKGMLWISWPKKIAKIQTDLTEQVLRDVLLPTGLVDVKVCAIDETWSGLKFVWRKK